MEVLNNQHSRRSFYTGLDSSELERLPRAATIYHATRLDTDAGLPVPRLVFSEGQVSFCHRRVTVVLPRPFDLTDRDACPQCIRAVTSGLA